MNNTAKSGAAIAAAAAALLLSGAVAPTEVQAEETKGQCMGANACKGQSACMTATSSCGGTNACKGQGFLVLTEAECKKIPGTTFKPGKGMDH